MPRPVNFANLPPDLPDWMDTWPTAFESHFRKLLSAYRTYVEQHYADERDRFAAAFMLVDAVEVVAVAAVTAIWVFARPADADSIQIRTVWEDEMLADWDFMEQPFDHRVEAVAQAFLTGTGWNLFEELNLCANGWLDADGAVAQYYDSAGEGRRLAEQHAGQIKLTEAWTESVRQALQEPGPDEGALARVRERLAALGESDNPQMRGRQFEAVVHDLLEAHGCDVEQGNARPGEQVDVFMTAPIFALIECRWEKDPLEVDVMYVLRGKLAKRPAGMVGLYVSMSGFTRGAKDDVRNAGTRTVFLMDRDDVDALARGELTFGAFYDAKMRALLTQYPD